MADSPCCEYVPKEAPVRNPIVDAARGYGIFFVFLGHLVYYDSPIFRVIFNFHMPLFFLLSGMVFANRNNQGGDLRSFCARQFNSIVVPFLFFTCLGFLICLFTGRLIQHSLMDWMRAGMTFIHGDPFVAGSLWFLSCLFVVKTLFWKWGRKERSPLTVMIFLVITYTTGVVCGKYIHPKILLAGPLMCFSVPMALFFFALGFYGRNILDVIAAIPSWKLVLISTGLFLTEVFWALPFTTPNLAIPSFPSACTFLLASICGIGAVLCLSGTSFIGPVVHFIGKNSLYYFLMERWIHEVRFSLFNLIWPDIQKGVSGNPNMMNLSPIQIVISFLGGLIVATLIMPVTKWALKKTRRFLTFSCCNYVLHGRLCK